MSLPDCPATDDVGMEVGIADLELHESTEEGSRLCSYYSGTRTLLLTAQLGGRVALEELRDHTVGIAEDLGDLATYRTLPGLGDEAFLLRVADPSKAGDVDSLTLFVRYGELVVASGGPTGDSRLSVAVELSRLMLP